MIYVIYFFAAGFIVLAGMMFFACYRHRHFGLFLMALSYFASGLLAMMQRHWWPLVIGFVLAWVLRMLGMEPKVEVEEARDEGDAKRDEGGGMRNEGKKQ
jgi:hypothetical protein